MLGFGKKKTTVQPSAPRERIVYRDRPEATQVVECVEKYLDLAQKEFARLTVEVDRQLSRRDAGKSYQQSELDRSFGKLNAITSAVAVLTGDEYALVSARMTRGTESLISSGEEFPLNSYFGPGSPIFQSAVDAGYAQDRLLRGLV